MSDFQPMHSVEAEMATLGAMLLSDRAAVEISALLKPRDFYRPAHVAIFKTMQRLVAASRPIDLVTLVAALEEESLLVSIGGQDYLTAIDLSAPSAANAGAYADVVLDRAKLRQADETARSIVRIANEGGAGAVEAILSEAKSIGERMTHGGTRMPEGDKLASIGRVLARKRGGGMATGFPSLDDRYCKQHRGLARGQFTQFQAMPGRGKSSTMFSVAFPAFDRGEKGIVASFADLTEDDVTYRAIRYCSGFAGTEEEGYDESEVRQIRDAADRFHGWDYTFYEAAKTRGGATIQAFRTWLLRHIDKNGMPSFVALDYAQRIETSDRRLNAEATPRNQHVAEEVRHLVGEVRDAAFLLGCQVTPKGKDASGEMEYQSQHSVDWDQHAALNLMMLEDGKTLKVTKNRFGTWNQKIEMAWLGGPQIVQEAR